MIASHQTGRMPVPMSATARGNAEAGNGAAQRLSLLTPQKTERCAPPREPAFQTLKYIKSIMPDLCRRSERVQRDLLPPRHNAR
jgi:hypothetical protein